MKNLILILVLVATAGLNSLAQQVDRSEWVEVPSARISGTYTVCKGETVTLVIEFSGGPVNIIYTDGLKEYSLNGLSTSPYKLDVKAEMTMIYQIISVTSQSGCTGVAHGNGIVMVNEIPKLKFDLPDSVTTNSSIIKLAPLVSVTKQYNEDYIWFIGHGVTGDAFVPTAVAAGVYSITANYTDYVTGCSNSITEQIVVYSP